MKKWVILAVLLIFLVGCKMEFEGSFTDNAMIYVR